MTEELSLRERLQRKERKLVTTVDVGGDKVDLRRPSHKERFAVLAAAKDAGDVDADHKPTSPEGGLRLLARMVAAVMYDPHAKLRLYDPASASDVEALLAPWLEDIQPHVAGAFKGSLEEGIKESEKNS
jgi:hypothetical protein